MIKTFNTLFLFLISFYTYAQEKEIQEVNIINKRTATKVIELVEKKFKTNFKKQDTLTFQTEFYNKESKLGDIYQLNGKLDFIFDDYFDANNHYYDSFIYKDTKYTDNSHLLDKNRENYISHLRNYLTPKIIYKVIKKRKQYHFSFIETSNEEVYKIEFSPLKPRPFRYKGNLTIDKKTFGILEFNVSLLANEGNNFTSMYIARSDNYQILYHQLFCSFNKNEINLFKLKSCTTKAFIKQKGNYNREYNISGSMDYIETPTNSSKTLFGIDGFSIYQRKMND